jgi:hypothetical protein
VISGNLAVKCLFCGYHFLNKNIILQTKHQKYHNVKKCTFFSSIFGADLDFVCQKRQDLKVEKIQKDRREAPPTSPRGGQRRKYYLFAGKSGLPLSKGH